MSFPNVLIKHRTGSTGRIVLSERLTGRIFRYFLGSRLIEFHSQNKAVATNGDGGEICLWTSVVTRGHPSLVLQATEYDLDAASPLVAPLVILDRPLALLPTGDASAYPLVLQRLSQPVSVITTIAEQPFDLRQAAEKRPRSNIIAYLPGSDK